jgi:hypothetical protein
MSSWAPASSRPLVCLVSASLLVATGACARRAVDAPASAGGVRPTEMFRAYRDPNTGQFREPPAGAVPTPGPAVAPSSLSEESAPGGGRMIRLHGAFRSHFVAASGADGLATSCASATVVSSKTAPLSP